ncbi:hypothetical protein P152DRAFT_460602 [Eremomyces bilateralis CBS 781.70]|uniref:18S rRNA factor 2 n=1 Tax=Eremomyces bilateralis CBS 781.70 TaxID=1392243 RepID=A0A6G1FXB4_9PEZI|nr:uncharacterized protein P152DRAFT_460602 [Eremomyces bilateralis CBS 781.70]KAF1810477.1 hypothetical protein P152DRAFT_460602 [Eremomyces bilateralis CBS 781.70]
MSTRKRDDYFDLEESDGGDSTGEKDDSRGRSDFVRQTKRRKVADTWDHSGSEDESEDEVEEEDVQVTATSDDIIHYPAEEELPASLQDSSSKTKERRRKSKQLSETSIAASQQAASKTGVVYVSRIPPFMTPQMLRQRLSVHGTLGRIFLTPESTDVRARKKKAGGSGRQSFSDGWVEFLKKSDAKLVAELLNTKIMGGKKRGFYHDDVWNIKYLKGFKWHHLTEQIANENAERAARMRAEIARTTKENKLFLQNIETAKMLEGMAAKSKGKEAKSKGKSKTLVEDGATEAIEPPKASKRGSLVREFKQNRSKIKGNADAASGSQPEVTRVLSKIF